MTIEEARRYALARARGRGISAEILTQRGRELTVRTHGGAVEHLAQAVQTGLGARVVVDGRVGYAYSEELTPAALDCMLDLDPGRTALTLTERTGRLLPLVVADGLSFAGA